MLEVFGVQPVIRPGIQNVTFYVMSSNDSQGLDIANYWTTMEVFPKFKPTSFYLHPDGSSNNEPVSSDSSEAVSTTYTYDPSNPIMGLGGNNLSPLPCGPLDQRASEDGRTDVLMFHTEPQPDNEALYLTGPIWAQLYVSTDAIDTDFTVKISDVFPTGEVRLLIDSAFRMRWREGGVEPVYTEIGEIYKIDVNLWNTSYALAPGHKFRFSISSSNYPRFSVNPNNGILLKDTNYPGQNITAQNTLYHSNKYQSKVILPVVNKSQLPQVHDIKEEILAAYPQLEKNINLDDIIQRANTVLSRH
jgi:putative CocE/NonD family hydrolase